MTFLSISVQFPFETGYGRWRTWLSLDFLHVNEQNSSFQQQFYHFEYLYFTLSTLLDEMHKFIGGRKFLHERKVIKFTRFISFQTWNLQLIIFSTSFHRQNIWHRVNQPSLQMNEICDDPCYSHLSKTWHTARLNLIVKWVIWFESTEYPANLHSNWVTKWAEYTYQPNTYTNTYITYTTHQLDIRRSFI